MITDTRITIETPEGADLPLDPAGVVVRMGAYLIDFIIRIVVFIAAAFILQYAGRSGEGILLILYFVLEWFYPVFFEVAKQGQTPGKKSMKIAVVNDDGTPVVFAGSLIRNLLRFVDFLPFAYVVGLVTSITNSGFKRVGDLAAGTLVVHVQRSSEPPALNIEEKLPIPRGFSTDEQRALLNFAERSSQLSLERQHELAEILKPVLGDAKDLVSTIKKMANSTLGGR